MLPQVFLHGFEDFLQISHFVSLSNEILAFDPDKGCVNIVVLWV